MTRPILEPYICYARPIALKGKTCGHRNDTGVVSWLGSVGLQCCEKCGATRKASDDRQARELASHA